MSMAAETSSFDANLLCSPLMNTSCYMGRADCRMSASIFNHKVTVTGNQVGRVMDRPVGYVLNQMMTENEWGKCAYLWKGDSSVNLNGGCGARAASSTCGDDNSAFANLCDGLGTCGPSSVDVTGRKCSCAPPMCEESYGVVPPPAQPGAEICFYEMKRLISRFWTNTDHLRDMLKQRVAYQADDETLTSKWNEVVIDEWNLIRDTRITPTEAIWAFVCVPSAHQDACKLATHMRDEYQTTYGVRGTIPVVALDVLSDFTEGGGPFGLPDARFIV